MIRLFPLYLLIGLLYHVLVAPKRPLLVSLLLWPWALQTDWNRSKQDRSQPREQPEAPSEDYSLLNFPWPELLNKPEGPLSKDTTITHAPTGVSKTYAAGTPFPSALLRDWERGVYRRPR